MEILKVSFVGRPVLLLKACQDKKLLNDLTKPGESARKVYDVKEWTIIRGIQLCPKKPTATGAAENQHLSVSRVTNRSQKYIFYSCYPIYLLVCSRLFWIDLWPSLSPLCSLIVIPYPFGPGRWNAHDICDSTWVNLPHFSYHCHFYICIFTLFQEDNCPSLETFSLHIASINHNRKADLRVENYKSIIVMMQINRMFLLKLSWV